MTREEIEQLNEVRPYCFETDREEQWYNIGLIEGLEVADNSPKGYDVAKDKTIQWLQQHINDYLVKGRDIDCMFDDLRKYMDEQ